MAYAQRTRGPFQLQAVYESGPSEEISLGRQVEGCSQERF